MARFPDPHTRLACQIVGISGGKITGSRQTPWASATFSGARHHYVLRVPRDGGNNDFESLNNAEFDLPGHILADIVLGERVEQADADSFVIEALTVEDA